MYRFIAPAILLLSSCSSASTCEVPLTRLDPEIQRDVISELQKLGVDYMVNEEGRICISDSDLKQATLVLESVVKGATPKEKSTSLDPEVHKRVLNRLAVDQIEYSERVIEGHTFLVWNSDDDDRVRAIIDEEFQKYAEEKFGKDFGRE